MLSSGLTSFLACALSISLGTTVVSASPSNANEAAGPASNVGAVTLLDYTPRFTYPTGGEVWLAGSQHHATWSQNLPQGYNTSSVTNTADIVLGYTEGDSLDEHLYYTLAQNVSLYAPGENSVTFTLPSSNLTTRSTYFLALIGSSGNTSPEFTIVADAPSKIIRKKRDVEVKSPWAKANAQLSSAHAHAA